MAKKIVFMLLNIDPAIPATLGSPFFQATVAAAMELEVEMYFSSRATSLLRQGVAAKLYPSERHDKSIYDFMRDAHSAGARFYACGASLLENDLDENNAIPEMDGVRGGAAFISAAIEDDVVTLTY